MPDKPPLTDEQIEARLGVALDDIGYDSEGETELGQNSLKAARQVLLALKMSLLKKMDQG
ncbi:MAG: hypothetical protein CML24_11460 [Rhizobiales bacterium]|nr:hypothetical protein [Hyphomicrobiales bacterium]|tara:strand:+ start:1485 stop:1664 length:180 start_codon:yes stop_codon:yes gene_type:complete